MDKFVIDLIEETNMDIINEKVLITQLKLIKTPTQIDLHTRFQHFVDSKIRGYLLVLITHCVDAVRKMNELKIQNERNENEIMVQKNQFLKYRRFLKDLDHQISA